MVTDTSLLYNNGDDYAFNIKFTVYNGEKSLPSILNLNVHFKIRHSLYFMPLTRENYK